MPRHAGRTGSIRTPEAGAGGSGEPRQSSAGVSLGKGTGWGACWGLASVNNPWALGYMGDLRLPGTWHWVT